jgi:serine O-acetyltransferase
MPTPAIRRAGVEAVDPIWSILRDEAEAMASGDSAMARLAHEGVLVHASLTDALASRMAQKLSSDDVSEMSLRDVALAAFDAEPELAAAVRADLAAVRDRDPACKRFVEPLLFFKGFQALTAQRVAHWLWGHGRRDLALYLQMRMSERFSVDIHPAARLGRGIMIDHGHSIVIGETAVVGDEVSMLHGVTLGGTGKETGDRHPKIGRGVLIGAGAKILGNIRVGEFSRIAAGSVVLKEVPPCKTVAGVPARVVGDGGCDCPSRAMDQMILDAMDILPDC